MEGAGADGCGDLGQPPYRFKFCRTLPPHPLACCILPSSPCRLQHTAGQRLSGLVSCFPQRCHCALSRLVPAASPHFPLLRSHQAVSNGGPSPFPFSSESSHPFPGRRRCAKFGAAICSIPLQQQYRPVRTRQQLGLLSLPDFLCGRHSSDISGLH